MKMRYTVRKQASGYSGSVTWIVWDTYTKSRVTPAKRSYLIKDAAEGAARDLNIIDMIPTFDVDPREFEVKHEEAKSKYNELFESR